MDADVEMRFFNVSEVILMNVSLAVIIATKDRSGEIKRHALTSLERSTCRDFLCVVWDASQDEETRRRGSVHECVSAVGGVGSAVSVFESDFGGASELDCGTD